MTSPTFLARASRALVLSCALALVTEVVSGCGGADSGTPYVPDRSLCGDPHAMEVMDPRGGFTCVCKPGYWVDISNACLVDPNPPPCTLPDTDALTESLPVTHLAFTSASGFNLDGINNMSPPAGMGATVAGCDRSDRSGGIDHGFADAYASLASTVDFVAAAEQSVLDPTMDAGTAVGLEITLNLGTLQAQKVANDSCVAVEIVVGAPGMPATSLRGNGRITNHVVTLEAAGPLVVPIRVSLAPARCAPSACADAWLPIQLRNVRVLATLDATHTHVLQGSLVGGSVFFQDCTDGTTNADGTCTGGAFEAQNVEGLAARLRAFAATSGMNATTLDQVLTGIRAELDLHEATDGSLSSCTRVGASGNDANSIAVSFAVDSP